MTNTLEQIPVNELEETALQSALALLHSSEIERMTFTSDDENDPVSIEVLIGKPADTDGHILVSTFGLGGTQTNGRAKIDETEYDYRSEFFALASNLTDAYKLAEVLAQLAFLVDAKKEAFYPGMVITGILPEEQKLNNILLSANPIGVHENHGIVPIPTKDFAVFWVAISLVSKEEAELINSNEEGWETFKKFTADLDIKAYDLDRNTYKA